MRFSSELNADRYCRRRAVAASAVALIALVALGTPEAFGEWIASESARWSRVIRERHITVD